MRLTYRDMMKRELAARKARNAFYSLRAYARDLELGAAQLSEILSEKKGLSLPMAKKIAKRLGLSADESEVFTLSAQALHARDLTSRREAAESLLRLQDSQAVVGAKIQTIVSWVAEAVMKMSQRGPIKTQLDEIALSLGTDPYEIQAALRFLTRLGFLKGASEKKSYLAEQAKGRRLNIDYEQILEQARRSYLRQRTVSDDFTHVALLLEDKDLAKVRRLQSTFFAELKKLEKSSSESRVYFIASQFFRVEK